MAFNIKTDWDKLVITLFAVTTAFNYGNQWLPHNIQMYILSGVALYSIWFKKR